MKPGIKPAKKSLATETSAIQAKMIIGIEGGIKMAADAALETIAALSARG
jgi:hypothetical protein